MKYCANKFRIKNYFFVFSLLIIPSFACLSVPNSSSFVSPSLESKILHYDASPLFRTARWSVYARYLDTKETVIDFYGGKTLATGSNLKLITAAAALETLGPTFTYQTDIFYDGNIQDGVLSGNLYIRGSGDPTLFSGVVPEVVSLNDVATEISTKLKTLKVTRVEGGIIADATLFKKVSVPYDWCWGDLGSRNAALPGALCLHENVIDFTVKATPTGVVFEKSDPDLTFIKVDNKMTVGHPRSLFHYQTHGLPADSHITVSGNIPLDGENYVLKAALPDPSFTLAAVLTRKIRAQGIALDGDPGVLYTQTQYDPEKRLYTVDSPRLSTIIYYLLKHSINLYAEQLCISLGQKKYGVATTAAGAQALSAYLAELKLPVEGLVINDGSGLSRYTAVSPKLIVGLLDHVASTAYFKDYYNALGIAGDPDDISFFTDWGRDTAMANNARIKSGSLGEVKAHSGYVTTKSGRLIAFSMIVNNYNGAPEEVTRAHQDLLLALAQLE